jgi:hypothetical protein
VKRYPALRTLILAKSGSAGNASLVMENDLWFRVAVIGGGVMSVILTATLFFMK